MYHAEGPWNSPQTDRLLATHMQAYHKAGIIAAYAESSRHWEQLVGSFNTVPAHDARQELAQVRRSELWLFPSVKRNIAGDMEAIYLQKVDDTSGVVIPSSTERVAFLDGNRLIPSSLPFARCDLSVVLDAIVDLNDAGLRAVDVAGLKQYY